MATPQLFLHFERNPPAPPGIVLPEGYEPAEAQTPEVKAALEAFIDQNLDSDSLSTKICNATTWAVLERPFEGLPGGDKKDVMELEWFIGNYDWEHLVAQAIDFANTTEQTAEIYLVPVLGQSCQAGVRHELTYNAFVCGTGIPPFTHIFQRLPRPPEESPDLELLAKSDPPSYVSLQDVKLEWADLMTFTKEQFEILEDKKIAVKILRPTKDFQTSLSTFYANTEEFNIWYDTTMSNFLPLIPSPMTEDGKMAAGWPSLLLQPIECTPPSYKKLVELCNKINDKLSREVDGERVNAIKNVIKYWQFGPNELQDAADEFGADMCIPKGSKAFNALFFQQYEIVRQFICEDILGGFLNIMRPPEMVDEWKGAAADIDEELEKWDGRVLMTFMVHPAKDELLPVMKEMKEEIAGWFGRDNAITHYNEFKQVVTESMKELMDSPAFQDYLKIFKSENESTERKKWLEMYREGKVLYCLWPTIYSVVGVRKGGEQNSELAAAEKKHMLHLHMSIPTSKGHVVPKQ